MSLDPVKFIKQTQKATCPKCGAPNKCAMEEGKSIHACWCIGTATKKEVSGDRCLCRKCLTEEE